MTLTTHSRVQCKQTLNPSITGRMPTALQYVPRKLIKLNFQIIKNLNSWFLFKSPAKCKLYSSESDGNKFGHKKVNNLNVQW